MNERQIAALLDFRAAFEFKQKCLNDPESHLTGAMGDALAWLKSAEKELYEATEGISL